MTRTDGPDPRFRAWLADHAPDQAPDALLPATMRVVEASRQSGAWQRFVVPLSVAAAVLVVGIGMGMALSELPVASGPSPSGTADASASASVEIPSAPLPTPPPAPSGDVPAYPTQPTGPLLSGSPLADADTDGEFALELTADQDRYRAGQPIEIEALLTYAGAEQSVTIGGPGGAVIWFTIQSTDPAITIVPAGNTQCVPRQIIHDQPMLIPFAKTRSLVDDDPMRPFLQAFFADPVLRLPAGEWTVTAVGAFSVGEECDGPVPSLSTSVTIQVEP